MKTEILSGPERRRRWSAAEKDQIVAAALAPEASVAAIARRHGVSRSLVYAWRREAMVGPGEVATPALVPVVVTAASESAGKRDAPATTMQATPRSSGHNAHEGVIEIALASGARLTVRGAVDLKGLRTVLSVLRG